MPVPSRSGTARPGRTRRGPGRVGPCCASVANRAGRSPRFSSASWIPLARCSIASMLDTGQTRVPLVVRRVGPHAVEREVGLVLHRIRHVLPRRVTGPSSARGSATAPAAASRRSGGGRGAGRRPARTSTCCRWRTGGRRGTRASTASYHSDSCDGAYGIASSRPVPHGAGVEQRERLLGLSLGVGEDRRRDHDRGPVDAERLELRRTSGSASRPADRPRDRSRRPRVELVHHSSGYT